MMKAVALSFAFLLFAGTAFARQGDDDNRGPSIKAEAGIDDRLQVSAQAGSPQPGDEIATGTPTFTERHGMSGPSMNQGKGSANQHQGSAQDMRGTPGIVTSVNTGSFTMTLPGNKNHATSTVTVNVSSTTKFVLASTTASLADVTVGSKVVVMGKLATTSKTIVADRVVIAGDGVRKAQEHRIQHFLDRIRHFFFGKGGDDNGRMEAEVHAEASASSSGLMAKLGALFGWL